MILPSLSLLLMSYADPRIPIWCSYKMLFGDPENVAASSCFSGFFRRVLCKNLIDASKVSQVSNAHDLEAMGERKSKLKEEMEAQSSPNIVARLMGLESMPEFDWMSRVSDTDHGKSQGKVEVKTSRSSSHESIAPAYLLQENDEFLLLSFDCHGYREKKSNKEKRIKNKGSCNHKKMNGDHIVRGRKRVDVNVEDDDIEIMILPKPFQSQSSYINVNNRKKEMEVSPENQSESDSSSDNSSPVSVLDRPFEEAIGFLAPDSELKFTEVVKTEKKEQDQIFVHHPSLWRGSSTHVEDTLLRNLNWVSMRDLWRSDGESEEMGAEIELQIFYYLVQDLANELLYT